MMLAAMMKAPTFALTVEESDKLANAINNVAQHYDVPLLDEKSKAWLALGMVGVEVYGTRVATVVIEAKKKPRAVTPTQMKAAHPNPPTQPITPIDAFTEAYVHGQA